MIQSIINGLMIGGVYALVATGTAMIFGVMKIVNFAQGEFVMLGLYLLLLLYPLIGEGSVPYSLMPFVIVIMFAFGMVIFQLTIKPVIGKDSSNYILLTLGLQYFLQNVVQLIFGSTFRSAPVPFELKVGSLVFGKYIFMTPRLIALCVALICVIIVHLFLSRTDTGRAMRATAENSTVAASLGIKTNAIYTIAFGIGAVFAGIAGVLLSPIFSIYPRVGASFGTIAMCCIVLGGLGNIRGAMIGGLIIGIVESLASEFIALDFSLVAINTVILLILTFLPYGIFGGGARKA